MKSITCDDLHNLILSGTFVSIIDIREPASFYNGHIFGAINVNSDLLLCNPFSFLNYYNSYYIICDYGITSPKVTSILEGKGFNVTNVLGGMSKWKYELTRKHL